MKVILKEVCPLLGMRKILRSGEVIERKEFDVIVMDPKHVRIGNHMFTTEDQSAEGIRRAILDAVPGLDFKIQE